MRDNSSQLVTSLCRCELQYDKGPRPKFESQGGCHWHQKNYNGEDVALLINETGAGDETLQLRKPVTYIDEVVWRDRSFRAELPFIAA